LLHFRIFKSHKNCLNLSERLYSAHIRGPIF